MLFFFLYPMSQINNVSCPLMYLMPTEQDIFPGQIEIISILCSGVTYIDDP